MASSRTILLLCLLLACYAFVVGCIFNFGQASSWSFWGVQGGSSSWTDMSHHEDYSVTTSTVPVPSVSSSSSSSSFEENDLPRLAQCSAPHIVQSFYDRHYKRFVDSCPLSRPYEECILEASKEPSYPWWMHRLFGNASIETAQQKKEEWFNQYQQNWHFLWFNEDPRLRFCRIEKVASTQWRHISFDFYQHPRFRTTFSKAKQMTGWEGNHTMGAPHAVFFRDPLERFLSAYLDKCLSDYSRKHCKPFEQRFPDLAVLRDGGGLYATPKQAFDSYISTAPLKWDVHFTPQALQCYGLFRTVHTYDFVGSMQDDRFVQDIYRFMDRYPNTKLSSIVAKEFNFSPNITNFRQQQQVLGAATTTTTTAPMPLNTTANNNNNNNNEKKEYNREYHPTGATEKLLQYYDANSVRQLLEYYSLDYVTLNLSIPTWIQQLLDDDCQKRFGGASGAGGAGGGQS